MYWRLFYKFKGVKGLNEAIENREIKDVECFLKVYLDRPFDLNDSECFKIFYFIIDNIKSPKHYTVCEEIMLNSLYFESMPQEKVVEALNAFAKITNFNTAKFSKFLFNKIINPQILLESNIDIIATLFIQFYGLGIEDLIPLLGIDYTIQISKVLSYANSKKLLTYYKPFDIFSDEFKTLCQKGDFRIEDISDTILNNYDALEFDILFSIVINKKNELTSPFLDFLKVINSRKEITSQHKNYIATKLIESKNYSQILDFLANVECPYNENLITELVGKVPEFILLDTISNKYIFFAVKKILEQGEVNTMEINTIDAIFLGQYDYEKLECILDSLYKIKPNIKFSKKTTIYLLKLSVNNFPTLINEYEFTEEERLEILTTLKEINSDWLIIYGNYLVLGNNITKTSKEIASEQIARIRSL